MAVRQRAVPAQDVHRGAAVDPTAVAVDMRTVFKAAVRDSLPHVSTWWPQILAAITTGVTNAASEGINRAIKTDAVHLYANAL
jgi:hypothetical protein